MPDFKNYAQVCTQILTEESLRSAQQQRREIRYLPGNKDVKKELAEQIARRDKIETGLICVLRAVEPCNTFAIKRDHERKTIEMEYQSGKCLHLYHDFNHERFGLMHVRLQTWFPFQIQVCLNGHEWLARQLTAAGIGFEKSENCIDRVDDVVAAQRLYDEQLKVSWPELLGELRRCVHPAHELLFEHCPEAAREYYWSASETEWSSDLLLKDPADAPRLIEQLVRAHCGSWSPRHSAVHGSAQLRGRATALQLQGPAEDEHPAIRDGRADQAFAELEFGEGVQSPLGRAFGGHDQ